VDLTDRLRTAAATAGLAGVGVCRADPFLDTRAAIEARVSGGLHGGLRFTYANPVTATDIRVSFPWAERLVVAAFAYVPGAGNLGEGAPGRGRVARFAGEDQYRVLRSGLAALAGTLAEAGKRAEILVDDSRLVDRAAAVRAGVGWWGRSTMVLAPGHGPWLLIGSVVTDAELPVDAPMRRDCGTCEACIPACPTGALRDGVLDARVCLAHRLQAAGVIPLELREVVGDRIYGCDNCLDACPPGCRSLGTDPAARGMVDLLGLLASSDRDLLKAHGHWYIPRRQPRYLRRNALVALGNTGGPGAEGVAAGYLGHHDWMLRVHAAWALGRLGGPAARAALRAAAEAERHADVAAEIESALGSLA